MSDRKKKRVKFKLGDLVQLNSFWDRRVGIVAADSRTWYVIDGHYDIANCICAPEDVVKVITPGAVPAKYLRYVR
jgi:hypothetical protein